jgi:hypothetical protein
MQIKATHLTGKRERIRQRWSRKEVVPSRGSMCPEFGAFLEALRKFTGRNS